MTQRTALWIGGGLVAAAGTLVALNQFGVINIFGCKEAYVNAPKGYGPSGFCRWPALKAYALQVGPGAAAANGRPCGYFWISLGKWQSAWGDPTNQDSAIPSNWQTLPDRVVVGWAMWYGGQSPSDTPKLVRVYPQVQKANSPEVQSGYFTGGYAC